MERYNGYRLPCHVAPPLCCHHLPPLFQGPCRTADRSQQLRLGLHHIAVAFDNAFDEPGEAGHQCVGVAGGAVTSGCRAKDTLRNKIQGRECLFAKFTSSIVQKGAWALMKTADGQRQQQECYASPHGSSLQ